MTHVLIIDDDASIRDILSDVVEDEGCTVSQAGDLRQARIHIERQKPDIVLLDMQFPDTTGIEIWKKLDLPDANLIFVTGHATIENAIEALRCGAVDYLLKPPSINRLRGLLNSLKSYKVNSVQPGRADCFAKLIGNSRAMKLLCAHIEKVAPTLATVLLIGESGTGKELAAEAVHLCSPRHAKPFLAVNCGAISPNLIESELFGHEKGSFTGADRQHKGYFERACGGTLFLDEITEMSMELQVRLLRVLETGRFMRVGTQEEVTADVRVVAATNRNLEEAVRNGILREDLYHRLSVFPLVLPPLREREDDLALLAQYFLDALNEEYGTNKKISEAGLQAIQKYSWPGNVRELKNYIYRSYILADEMIEGDVKTFRLDAIKPAHGAGAEVSVPVGIPLAEANRQLIMATLEQCGGVKKSAAEVLGISLKTLYNRLEEYSALSGKDDATSAP